MDHHDHAHPGHAERPGQPDQAHHSAESGHHAGEPTRAGETMDPAAMDHSSMNHAAMEHGAIDHAAMDHGVTDHAAMHNMPASPAEAAPGAATAHAGHEMPAGHDMSAGHEMPAGHDMSAGHDMGGGHDGHEGGAHADHGVADHAGHEQVFRRRFWVCLTVSVPVLLYSPMLQDLLGFSMHGFPGSDWIGPVFAVIVFAYGGVPFLQMAVPEIRSRQPGMMTLISLAISVALVYSVTALFLPGQMGFFWELVTLIDIMLLGHWLEMRSIRQASGALNELAKLMPDTAERIRSDGDTETVAVSGLVSGDRVLVRPGASLPADGKVVDGSSDVNESMLTGESVPVRKEPGATVIAGTINGGGSLRVEVTATGDATALAGIMRLVAQAQGSKSRTQLLANRAAGWLFYVALGVAAITAIAWTLATGFSVDVIARVATVLVIACPHALGLAIPLVVAITTSMGARAGILVRDRMALEEARLIDTVIFDKTGTLTTGVFGVVGMAMTDGWDEQRALALTAAIEGDSEHTIARGIRESAEKRGLTLPAVSGFQAIQGRGVQARWQDRDVQVGGPRLLESLGLTLPEALSDFERAASDKGQSVVHLVVDGEPVASLVLADVIREESRQAVRRLQAMGIEVAMLTGDSQAVAKAVAQELGIDTYFAEVLPEHKDRQVIELQRSGKKVAMVGDGVNDAPA
jgi:Cu2+-exporting ATPase